MIKEFEFYHGCVFANILHSALTEVAIKRYDCVSNAAYVVNDSVGLYIKHSTKRLSPWRFSFLKRHQDEMEQMKKELADVLLVLVCDDDGIAVLSYDEVKQILNEVHEEIEWVSVERKKNGMYSIAGSDGRLGFKVGKADLKAKLFSRLTKRVSAGTA